MSQDLVPIQDIITWNTGTFEDIDDGVAADDDTFILSDLAPNSDPIVVKLAPGTDPVSSIEHVLNYRYSKIAGTAQIDLLAELRQGYLSEASKGTLIADTSHSNIGTALTNGALTCSGAEADSITDYGSLYARFVASVGGASVPTFTVRSPTSGVVGTTITATGTNFVVGATTVHFGTIDIAAGDVTVNSATELTFAIPAGAVAGQTYAVSIETAAGTSGTLNVSIDFPPFEPVVLASINTSGNDIDYGFTGQTLVAGRLYYAVFFTNESGGDGRKGTMNTQSGTQTWDEVGTAGDLSTWTLRVFRFRPSETLTDVAVEWVTSDSVQHDGCIAWLIEVPEGHDTSGTNGSGATPSAQVSTKTGSSNSQAATIASTPATDSIVIVVVGHANAETNTPTGGVAELSDLQVASGPAMSASIAFDNSSPGTTPGASWTTAGNNRLVAWEVLAA